MSDKIVEILEIACDPDRPDMVAWRQIVTAIVEEFRGVLMKHEGAWLTVGFLDEATAWAACQAIHATGEYVAGPLPAEDGDV